MSNQGYRPIPVYSWKGMVVNAVQEFFKETGLDEVQVNAWYIRQGKEPECIDHGTAIQDHDWYIIQSGGRWLFDSIKVWVPKAQHQGERLLEPALDQLARELYPESDKVHIKKLSRAHN